MANTVTHPQIRVSAVTKEELRQLGEKGESFDDIIRRLIVTHKQIEHLAGELTPKSRQEEVAP